MADQEFSIGFTSNTFYLFAAFPAAVAIGLMYAGTRLSPAILYFVLGGLAFGLAMALAYNAYSINNLKLRVTKSELQVGKRSVAVSSIKFDGVRRVDLRSEPEFVPTRRKNGTEIAGLKEGWWLLQNGEKACVALTDERNAVYVPTSEGFSFLISPTDPSSFLNALRAVQPGEAAR